VVPRGSGFFFHFLLLVQQILVPILEHVNRDHPDPLAATAFDFDRFLGQLGYKVSALAPLVDALFAIEIFKAAFALNGVVGEVLVTFGTPLHGLPPFSPTRNG
jgi:hypothetical protein